MNTVQEIERAIDAVRLAEEQSATPFAAIQEAWTSQRAGDLVFAGGAGIPRFGGQIT